MSRGRRAALAGALALVACGEAAPGPASARLLLHVARAPLGGSVVHAQVTAADLATPIVVDAPLDAAAGVDLQVPPGRARSIAVTVSEGDVVVLSGHTVADIAAAVAVTVEVTLTASGVLRGQFLLPSGQPVPAGTAVTLSLVTAAGPVQQVIVVTAADGSFVTDAVAGTYVATASLVDAVTAATVPAVASPLTVNAGSVTTLTGAQSVFNLLAGSTTGGLPVASAVLDVSAYTIGVTVDAQRDGSHPQNYLAGRDGTVSFKVHVQQASGMPAVLPATVAVQFGTGWTPSFPSPGSANNGPGSSVQPPTLSVGSSDTTAVTLSTGASGASNSGTITVTGRLVSAGQPQLMGATSQPLFSVTCPNGG